MGEMEAIDEQGNLKGTWNPHVWPRIKAQFTREVENAKKSNNKNQKRKRLPSAIDPSFFEDSGCEMGMSSSFDASSSKPRRPSIDSNSDADNSQVKPIIFKPPRNHDTMTFNADNPMLTDSEYDTDSDDYSLLSIDLNDEGQLPAYLAWGKTIAAARRNKFLSDLKGIRQKELPPDARWKAPDVNAIRVEGFMKEAQPANPIRLDAIVSLLYQTAIHGLYHSCPSMSDSNHAADGDPLAGLVSFFLVYESPCFENDESMRANVGADKCHRLQH